MAADVVTGWRVAGGGWRVAVILISPQKAMSSFRMRTD